MPVPEPLELLRPDWPVAERVRAVMTTRAGGVSRPPYDSLNLGDHVGDDPAAVTENRRRLVEALGLPGEPRWLRQVHGCRVAGDDERGIEADAGYSREPGQVCVVMTADCLPVLFASRSGDQVAVAHAGWRGLAGGVLEQTLARFSGDPARLCCWLGPAIGPESFEVGAEVVEAFTGQHAADAAAFQPGRPGRYLADIYQLARNRLRRAGVGYVAGGDYCTVRDARRFYSYRRDGVTGRMATLVWIEQPTGERE